MKDTILMSEIAGMKILLKNIKKVLTNRRWCGIL